MSERLAAPCPQSARVHLVDDEETIRDALGFLFASRGVALAAWPSGESYLAERAWEQAGCLILDLRMEGLSGAELFEHLRAAGCRLPVIFLTGHGDVAVAVAALKAGAFDFIEKPFNDNEIVDRALEAIAAHENATALEGAKQDIARKRAALSAREAEVMGLMLAGQLNKQIADQLGIAMRTVEVHRSRVMAKMGARNIAELAALLAAG